jgi:ribosomal RNA-processing protein 9
LFSLGCFVAIPLLSSRSANAAPAPPLLPRQPPLSKNPTARDYLAQIRAIERADADSDDEEADGDRLRDAAADAAGRLHRRLASRLRLPSSAAEAQAGSRFVRAHRLSTTAVALTSDDRTAFTVSKDGSIFRWDVETMRKVQQLRRPGANRAAAKAAKGARGAPGANRASSAEWVRPAARLSGGDAALYAAAVSSDGRFLAVGGGSGDVHVFDVGSGAAAAPTTAAASSQQQQQQHLFTFPGHKDAVTGLAFREGSHDLYSCALDRTVKLWSVAEGCYVDTLFGHQSPCSSISCLRAERCVTAGSDRTCRVWKIPEESQLVFRAPASGSACLESVAHVSGTEWVSGGADGTVALWSQTKKRPVHVVKGAHGGGGGGVGHEGLGIGEGAYDDPAYERALVAAGAGRGGAAGAGGGGGGWADLNSDARRWVQSVAAARGTDLAASGAGDGCVRLWRVAGLGGGGGASGGAGATALEPVGALPARGFVNGLALARSGRFLLAAVGLEPRLGRWARWPRGDGAANGLLRHVLPLEDD